MSRGRPSPRLSSDSAYHIGIGSYNPTAVGNFTLRLPCCGILPIGDLINSIEALREDELEIKARKQVLDEKAAQSESQERLDLQLMDEQRGNRELIALANNRTKHYADPIPTPDPYNGNPPPEIFNDSDEETEQPLKGGRIKIPLPRQKRGRIKIMQV